MPLGFGIPPTPGSSVHHSFAFRGPELAEQKEGFARARGDPVQISSSRIRSAIEAV